MSWSVHFIGTPENVVKALEGYSEKLSGTSKTEYDNALPNLTGLVKQNFNHHPGASQLIKVVASGHAYIENGEPKYGTCNVQIETLFGEVV